MITLSNTKYFYYLYYVRIFLLWKLLWRI